MILTHLVLFSFLNGASGTVSTGPSVPVFRRRSWLRRFIFRR